MADIQLTLDPDDPDGDTDQTAYLYHNEAYMIEYSASSGHVLTANDYLFFVPASASACPAVAPALSGGFLGGSGQISVTLSAASSPYVMCVREGLLNTDPIYMHRHLTAVVSYRSPSPPGNPPPPSPPPGKTQAIKPLHAHRARTRTHTHTRARTLSVAALPWQIFSSPWTPTTRTATPTRPRTCTTTSRTRSSTRPRRATR